ncbi:GPI mannosyltransferase [Naematelia encephala]|uniref:Mannosyltransferase n=1 Tax=Naematelia encephala TaxID=71784 RepID=A0A1Y2AK82_9TREE|nr:GPI mannosyltransferase [Naematelia encephala]
MSGQALTVSFAFRSLSLLLPQTFFQPDEFWQALEPAHHFIFGYGHLTWEWLDLPNRGDGTLWDEIVVGGRLRSWLWPSIFAGIYKLLVCLKLDHTSILILAPRIVGVVIASLTDWYTCRLATKILGPGSTAGALFLSLTSLFNAHLLPRSLSTSPETLLTVMALCYFPLQESQAPDNVVITNTGLVPSRLKHLSDKKDQDLIHGKVFRIKALANLDYSMLDRMTPHTQGPKLHKDNFAVAVALAALAICIRPTTVAFWAYMGTELAWRTTSHQGITFTLRLILMSALVASSVFAASTWLDYAVTGRLAFPLVSFVNENLFQGVAAFYGSTNYLYHLTQSLPIMLFPIWWWFGRGFIAALLPSRSLPGSLAELDCPEGLRSLARGLVFAITILSLSPHSEWRFLHPFLPPMLLFALPALFQDYVPTIFGCYRLAQSLRQYTRLGKLPFYLCIIAPLVPYLYLNAFHGRAQIEVMNVLREGRAGNITSLLVLAPCHSTPWMSHLHTNVLASFITCEPPNLRPHDEPTQQEAVYSAPILYLDNMLGENINTSLPSHVVLFGSFLDLGDGSKTVRQALEAARYSQVWQGWNGFDFAQDEQDRKGHVRIWTRDAYQLD